MEPTHSKELRANKVAADISDSQIQGIQQKKVVVVESLRFFFRYNFEIRSGFESRRTRFRIDRILNSSTDTNRQLVDQWTDSGHRDPAYFFLQQLTLDENILLLEQKVNQLIN